MIEERPFKLLHLIHEQSGDDWEAIMDRMRAHPAEIMISGNSDGMNALHLVCLQYPPFDVINQILTVCPQAAVQQNKELETPLHIAVYSDADDDLLLALISEAPHTVAITDRYGETPLHYAVQAGASFAVLEAMLHASPQAMHIVNHKGRTPLWYLRRSYLTSTILDEIFQMETSFTNNEVLKHSVDPIQVKKITDPTIHVDFTVEEAVHPLLVPDVESDTSSSTDDEQFATEDWDRLVLFLQFAYYGSQSPNVSFLQDGFDKCTRNDFAWMVHAAAATPSCPRDSLLFLCYLFPEQALVFDTVHHCTPLLLACRAPFVNEPNASRKCNDSVLSMFDRTDQEYASKEAEAAETVDFSSCKESAIAILCRWCPASAQYMDQQGRLPLAHALRTGKPFGSCVRPLLDASVTTLETIDGPSGMLMFQLAALPPLTPSLITTSLDVASNCQEPGTKSVLETVTATSPVACSSTETKPSVVDDMLATSSNSLSNVYALLRTFPAALMHSSSGNRQTKRNQTRSDLCCEVTMSSCKKMKF
jgi:hypothetical protein